MRIAALALSALLWLPLGAQTPAPETEVPRAEGAAPAEAPAASPQTAAPEPVQAAQPAAAPQASETAILLLYREKKFMGAGLRPSIFIDDTEVAYISNGTYLKVKVAPGDHSIYADAKKEALDFPVEAGKTYYFRVVIRAGLLKGHGKLEPVDEATGLKETTEWKASLSYAPKILKPEMMVMD